MEHNKIVDVITPFIEFLRTREGEKWTFRGQGPMRHILVCDLCERIPAFMGVIALVIYTSPSGAETFKVDPLMFKRYLMADGVGYNVSKDVMQNYMDFYGGMSNHDNENLAYCNDVPFPMAYMMDKGIYRVNAALYTDFLSSKPKAAAPLVTYLVFFNYKLRDSFCDAYVVVKTQGIEATADVASIEIKIKESLPAFATAFKITNVSRL